jgi:putative oxidoreductase
VNSNKVAPFVLSALRIVAALLFLAHATQKLFAFPGGPRAPLLSLLGAAGLIELVGGVLMLVGVFARPVAFVLAGEMAFAYFRGHAPRGPWPSLNGGELAVLFCFLWLYFSVAGPGPVSVDRVRRRA